ncbi:MAG TPA: hypothetical protein V6C88_15720 [Chroococcidiopsis sp.]
MELVAVVILASLGFMVIRVVSGDGDQPKKRDERRQPERRSPVEKLGSSIAVAIARNLEQLSTSGTTKEAVMHLEQTNSTDEEQLGYKIARAIYEHSGVAERADMASVAPDPLAKDIGRAIADYLTTLKS